MAIARPPARTDLPAHGWAIIATGSRLEPHSTVFDPWAISRMFDEAAKVAPKEQTLFVALEAESPWWTPLALGLPADNVINQPIDRGSAPGILVALFHILRCDPNAQVTIFAPGSSSARKQQLASAPLAEILLAVRDAQPELYFAILDHLSSRRDELGALDDLYPFLPAIDFQAAVLARSPEAHHRLQHAAA